MRKENDLKNVIENVIEKDVSCNLKHLDLCAGTGAFSLCVRELGGKTVFANDLEPTSKKLYDANFKYEQLTVGDINDPNVRALIPDHDLLTAGFPCQPFSIAGERRGLEDNRSNVFFSIARILEAKRPRFFVLENVKNLGTHNEGKTFQVIRDRLTELNYYFSYYLLNTCKISPVPQNRERIYIVGFANEADHVAYEAELPKGFTAQTVRKSPAVKSKSKEIPVVNQPIREFLEDHVNDRYFYTDKLAVYPVVMKNVIKENVVYQYRKTYVRENMSNVCPTLTANMGTGGHNVPLLRIGDRVRKLTPRECFNLQGFPPDYILPPKMSDAALYKLAGNAVSVPVALAVLKGIFFIHSKSQMKEK